MTPCARHFCSGLDEHNDESPNPEQFTEDSASVVGGWPVDDRELRHAVATADARIPVNDTSIDRSSRENMELQILSNVEFPCPIGVH